ncbi:MAG: DinB family protein [Planctomycetota bacterium]
MQTKELLRHVEYNAWATRRLQPAITSLSFDEFHKNFGGSFGSIHGTCVHLAGVAELWYSRWNGTSPLKLASADAFPQDAAQLFERWNRIDAEIVHFVRSLADPAREISMTNTSGKSFIHSYSDMILHFVNHQSYHRGQLTLYLRQLGKEAPAQDLIYYIREKNHSLA